ncbi:hypothetical protein [Gulosibacter sp. ACHW.36C]|uniref:Uncharacterized protein n=1 Tax=Gulosibacter sediminis TaxID=1729695 RepID=A0ABY4MYK3_9MICO|nr:hypothetical protein [Gulosibacter sediminis]UQN15474.1 hypothetical protein M3M28_03130 [Gulosibacter sediminis]
MAEGAAELADLASRRTHREGEQHKLLQAHYAGAIPPDLQNRITASLQTIESWIDEDNDVRVGYRNPCDGLSVPGLHADALSWSAQEKNEGQVGTLTKGGPLVERSNLTHLG